MISEDEYGRDMIKLANFSKSCFLPESLYETGEFDYFKFHLLFGKTGVYQKGKKRTPIFNSPET